MDKYLEACVKSAMAGGKAISDYKPEEAETKNDRELEYHAVVTSADFRSQDAILKKLSIYDEESMLITEENVKNPSFASKLIKSSNLSRISNSRVYIIDELDGSSPYNKGHPEWSISIGYIDRLEHKAGAVFAPHIKNGMLFYASKGEGAFIKAKKEMHVSKTSDLNKAYVIFGPDCFLKKYPTHNKLLIEIGDVARTVNGIGSCALGLGYVASGMSDALVQPLHFPWDWAAGKVLVEEAGGKMIFYEMENSNIRSIRKLEPKHYNPDKRMVGFVAGNGKIADEIMNILLDIK